MTNYYVVRNSLTTGDNKLREVRRTVEGDNVGLQAAYLATRLNKGTTKFTGYWWELRDINNMTFYPQVLAYDTITLNHLARPSEVEAESLTHNQVLTRNRLPDTYAGLTGGAPGRVGTAKNPLNSGSINYQPVIRKVRYFVPEEINESIASISSFTARVSMYIEATAGIGYLQRLEIKIRKLTADNHYQDLGVSTLESVTGIVNTDDQPMIEYWLTGMGNISGDVAEGDNVCLEMSTWGKASTPGATVTHTIGDLPIGLLLDTTIRFNLEG
jgi:hypothetical protein